MPKWIPDTIGGKANKPIHNVKIDPQHTYDEVRVVSNKFAGWLKVQVLAEIAQELGILKGGIIPAPLVYARAPNGIEYLIPIGSKRYNTLNQLDKLRSKKPIRIRNLVAGRVYQSINGTIGIYLGRVNVIRLSTSHIYPSVLTYNIYAWNLLFWFEMQGESTMPLENSFTEWFAENIKQMGIHDVCHSCVTKRSHSYRQQVAEVSVDLDRVISLLKQRLRRENYVGEKVSMMLTMSTGTPSVDYHTKEVLRKNNGVLIPPDITVEELPELLAHRNEDVRKYVKDRFGKLIAEAKREAKTK